MDFFKGIGSGVLLILAVYCEIAVMAADYVRRRIGLKQGRPTAD